jgi:nicotinate dehydrogenase subunit A
MEEKVIIQVNGSKVEVSSDPDTPLLYILRNNLALNGPKYGCGLGQCGTCLVLLDGQAVPSCQVRIKDIGDSPVITLEGLIQSDGSLSAIQQAFIEEQAAQCGYCLNGMVIRSFALLRNNPHPEDLEIREALTGNICRCGVHARVLKAVKRASSPS